MITIDQIRALKEQYQKITYAGVRAQQKIDQEYYDDSFLVPEIRAPHKVYRSGIGAEIVNSPSEQMVTRNPQAFFESLTGNKDMEMRLSKEVNQVWIDVLRRQNPNPFKEFAKNLLLRGDAFVQLAHNQSWVTKKKERLGLPVLFAVPDSMVIYASPKEDENGIPENVIVLYSRQPLDVILKYPNWANPNRAGFGENKNAEVSWFEYWDGDVRYFEADGEPILRGGDGELGIQKNDYGFVPFIHKYSGFGRRSPEGKLDELIVSDIRNSRDLIRQECAIGSDIASIFYLFAHRPIKVTSPGEVNKEDFKTAQWGAYVVNIFDKMTPGTEIEREEATFPSAEAFMHYNTILTRLKERHPLITAGFPWGTSGIQQKETFTVGMRRYDTVIEGTDNAFATAIEKAIQICGKIPTLKPDGLHKDDTKTIFKCQIELKAKDPVEEDRLETLGERHWQGGNGSISLKTLHMKYMGLTRDEHEEEVAEMMADKLTLQNPDVAAVYGMMFAEESQLEGLIQKARERQAMMQEQQKALQKQAPKTTEERIRGEAETEEGREMGVPSGRGARRPPERYTRE